MPPPHPGVAPKKPILNRVNGANCISDLKVPWREAIKSPHNAETMYAITKETRQKSRETRVSEDLPFFKYSLSGFKNIIETNIVCFLRSSPVTETYIRITILQISYRNTPNKCH